jgi:hypothetical protein
VAHIVVWLTVAPLFGVMSAVSQEMSSRAAQAPASP